MNTPTNRPSVKIEQVSPQMADKYLSSQVRNRHLRESRVEFLLGLIERDEWELTNDAISFDVDGQLINGQHRLTAIVVSGRTLPLVVLRGLGVRVQDTMDSGLQRSTSDALKLRGEQYTTALAAILRWEHRLRYIYNDAEDARREGMEEKEVAVHYSHGADRPTTAVLLRIFDKEPEAFREAAKLAFNLQHSIKCRASVVGVCWRRFAIIDSGDAGVFFEKLLTGADLRPNDPILKLRNLFINRRTQRDGQSMPDYREMAYMIKAWNYWRDGAEINQLTWHYGGRGREGFPVPK